MELQLLILVGQLALRYGPAVGEAWQKIFSNPNPTDADWKALWAIPHKSYEEYIAGQ